MNRADATNQPNQQIPLTGAYYWVPRPSGAEIDWDLLTCHDLGIWDGVSHREAWPYVLEHLAVLWGRDARGLKRRLKDHYTGLPRGRVTHPKAGFFIFHGKDAPSVPDWLDQVQSWFHLTDMNSRAIFDEHERMLRDDLRAMEKALGISLGLDNFV